MIISYNLYLKNSFLVVRAMTPMKNYAAKPPAAVLATARSGGSIAAVRSLGRANIPVTVLSYQYLAATSWSRYATSIVLVPDERDTNFVNRLCDIGQSRQKQVLLPTSDQTAWLYSQHSEQLGEKFLLYQPDVKVLEQLLDKSRLHQLCAAAGLGILPTWTPTSLEDVIQLAPTLPYPVLIKPRSHINRLSNNKGELTTSASELVSKYSLMLETENLAQEQSSGQATEFPVLQQFAPMGRDGVISVSGFIDRTGELFVSRISSKVFLRRYPAGVGVCYESRSASQELSEAARKLCLAANFYGVFEIEFIRCGNSWAAIDFNPRLFSQIGLDIARGMPLPNLLWLAAQDNYPALKEAVSAATNTGKADAEVTLYDRFTLAAIRAAKVVTSRSAGPANSYWREWLKSNAPNAIDYAWDRRDPLPGLIHVVSELGLGLKALPRFMRSVAPSFTSPAIGADVL